MKILGRTHRFTSRTGSSLFRQGKRNVGATEGRFGVSSSTGGNHDVLPSLDHVGGGCGDPGKRQFCFPQKLSRTAVESTEAPVGHGGADKEHAAGGEHRASVILRTSIFHALLRESGVLAERCLPDVFARC